MEAESVVKLIRPKVRDVLVRNRLYDLLDKAGRCPATWISSPPGSGKTSLVSGYMDHLGAPCLWYRLEKADRDPSAFFHCVTLGVQGLLPRRNVALPAFVPEHRQDLPAFSRKYFEAVCAVAPKRLALVLDNYQEVSPIQTFHDLLAQHIRNMPEGLRLFIISRNHPPACFARLMANGLCSRLGWEELRFTLEETRAFLQERKTVKQGKGDNREADDARAQPEAFHHWTQGWIAGMVLMAGATGIPSAWSTRSPHTAPSDSSASNPYHRLDRSRNTQVLFNYFASEVMTALTREMGSFLMKTALFPAMTARMAGEISGNPKASELLNDLNDNHYFTDFLPGRPPLYQYHPLFREFLLTRARSLLDPRDFALSKSRAARILEKAGDIQASARLYAEVKEWDRLCALLRAGASGMVERGEAGMLLDLIGLAPESLLQDDPWLLYWAGRSSFPVDSIKGRDFFEAAFKGFQHRNSRNGLLLSWCEAVNSVVFTWETVDRLDPWIDWMNDYTGRHPEVLDPEIEIRVCGAMVAALCCRRPQQANLEMWVKRLLRADEQNPESVQGFTNALHALNYFYWTGRAIQAQLLLKTLASRMAAHPRTPLETLIFNLHRALFSTWTTGDTVQALEAVETCLGIAREHGFHACQPLVLANGVYAALSAGDLSGAEAFLRALQKEAGVLSGRSLAPYHLMAAWHALLCRDSKQALAYSRKSLEINDKTGTPFPETLHRIAAAVILSANGQQAEANRQLDQAMRMAKALKSDSLSFLGRLARAGFDPNSRSGLHALAKAMEIGSRENYLNTLWGWDRKQMTRLCLTALEHDIQVPYVQELILRRRLFPQKVPVLLRHWPWTLKIRCLGRFVVEQGGLPLAFKGPARGKPLALLKALIAFGGREVPAARVADALWPDAHGDAAERSLKFTLHSLRKMLGITDLLTLREGLLSLDERLCWTDVRAFESLFEEAMEPFHQDHRPTGFAERAEQAMALYRGDFLAQEGGSPWLLPMRERLISRFIRLVGALASHYEAAGEWDRAIASYCTALETHPLQEAFYRHIMLCYLKQGRRADALVVYQRCEALFHAVLGIEPSPETKSLLSEIGVK